MGKLCICATIVLLCWVIDLRAVTSMNPSARNHSVSAAQRPGQMVASWVTDLMEPYPQISQLPFAIPETSNDQLFTTEEAWKLAGGLNSDEAHAVHRHVEQTLERRRRQAETLSIEDRVWGTPPSGPRYVQRPILFRNPVNVTVDIIGAFAEIHAPLTLDNNITQLVNYRLFRQLPDKMRSWSIPASMQLFINEEFNRLKTGLSPAKQKELKRCEVSVRSHVNTSDPNRVTLIWVGSNRTPSSSKCKYTVFITPVLARTIFVYSLRGSVQAWSNIGGIPEARLDEMAGLVLNNFRRQLHFVLAHELAHIALELFDALTENEFQELEIKVDDEAVRLVRRLDGQLELGAFDTILQNALIQGAGQLWGLERVSDQQRIISRLQRLTKQ